MDGDDIPTHSSGSVSQLRGSSEIDSPSTFTKVAIESAIARALNDMKLTSLKPKQFEAVYSFMSGHDTFVSLPTGYGKSIIYGVLPKAFDFLFGCTGSIAVVVTPLTSLMMDQRKKFVPRNVSVEF